MQRNFVAFHRCPLFFRTSRQLASFATKARRKEEEGKEKSVGMSDRETGCGDLLTRGSPLKVEHASHYPCPWI